MTLYDFFISTASTSLVVGALLVAARDVIANRLSNSVKHEFDVKLETARTAIRERESELQHDYNRRLEALRSELKNRESEIGLLRSHMLSGLSGRRIARDAKLLESIDLLWSCWVSIAPLRLAVSMVGDIDYPSLLKMAQKQEENRDVFKALDIFDLKHIKGEGWKARPYVSPLAWALFSAYSTLIISSVMKIKQGSQGVRTDFFNDQVLIALLKTVLPEHSSFIDQQGVSAFPRLHGSLEEKFLTELTTMLDGTESDQQSLDQAKSILAAIPSHLVEVETATETNPA